MPFTEIPSFIARLKDENTITALALEFVILTAVRTGELLRSVRNDEVMGARWDEIDVDARVWTIPAVRMKAGRTHRVPLTPRALEILREVEPLKRPDGFLFPGNRAGHPLSEMSLLMLLRRMKTDGITVHGFRSTFRDWAGEETSFPREVAEAALAHTVGNVVEQAYRRGDALEKRRKLMDAWANYCDLGKAGNVLPLRKASP